MPVIWVLATRMSRPEISARKSRDMQRVARILGVDEVVFDLDVGG